MNKQYFKTTRFLQSNKHAKSFNDIKISQNILKDLSKNSVDTLSEKEVSFDQKYFELPSYYKLPR